MTELMSVDMFMHVSLSVKSNFSNSQNIKNECYVHPSCFFLSRGMKSINLPFINFIACSLFLSHPKTPKGKLLVLVWKIVRRKKWFQPAQPCVFPLNKTSDRAGPWCTSVVGAGVCSRVHKQSHVSQQTECSLQSPRHPDENIMFYST